MKIRTLATLLAATVSSSSFAQSDDCAAPTPIQGSGVHAFDLTNATFSGDVGSTPCSLPSTIVRDVWYCWTAECDGMVTISTCTATMCDTVIEIYPAQLGCSCPGDLQPLCCNDDGCGKQSNIACEVQCGLRYMIRLSAKKSPSFVGNISFQCGGTPCDDHPAAPIVCAPCCGARPAIVDSSAVNFNAGAVAAGTNFRLNTSEPAVTLFDLGNQGSAPIGVLQSWNTGRYSHADWSMGKLGCVFGVVIDEFGDTFATHTVVYGWDMIGTVGGAGSVYRLDSTTGAASEFIRLPNAVNAAGDPLSGLGQVDYSCLTRLYYVSNFEDGRIYAINGAGAVVSTFDHATGTVTGALAAGNLAEPNDVAGPAPLGERVWAVKAVDGRLVYSLWIEDSANSNATRNNEIYSIALDANGGFTAGTVQLELTMPDSDLGVTQPVADIAFDANCCMYTAERAMVGISQTQPHAGRLLKFCSSADGWTPAPETFWIGQPTWTNSVGGVDIEALPNDRVWSIGDAIELNGVPANNIYGLIGFPFAGGDRDNSILLDFDNIFITQQKTELGSIDLSCVEEVVQSNCEFATLDIDCVPTETGGFNYLWTVEITNNSSATANLLILSNPAFAPGNVVLLPNPLTPGSSVVMNIPITGVAPGHLFCFTATLAASGQNECCTEEICIDLPDCTCFEYDAFVHDLPGNSSFSFSLSLINLEPYTAEWMTFAVAPGYAATINPSLLDIAGLPTGVGMSTIPVTITTNLPAGSPITIIVGIHSESFHPCCFREITVYVPAQSGHTTPGDVNSDGFVNAQDLAAVLGGWASAGSSDLNNDGTTDGADLAIVLANWS